MYAMSPKFLFILLLGFGKTIMGQEPSYNVADTTKDVFSSLKEVVVTANRDNAKRSESPVAISTINNTLIRYTHPVTIDQLLNKVSGVNMVSLGNEQHQMSIRQPMTTRSLFLYLEDGIPIRTTGLFNHNALLEINMAAVKNVEVIKGPSSSFYGSEAIGGVVNFITYAPTDQPGIRLSVSGNNIGYKRTEGLAAFSQGRLGITVAGYYADKRNSYLEFTDYHKGTVTLRGDYRFSDRTSLSNNIIWLNYYSDMPGGIDSSMFAGKAVRNLQSFTYRKVEGLRYHSTLTHVWNDMSKTFFTAIYRNNSIGQNPAYRISDDYKKQNGAGKGRKDLAHGEINKSSFNSYAFTAQHKQQFTALRTALIGGVSADISPSDYSAKYIRIKKDTVTGKYISYDPTDSVLSDYRTGINNYAGFVDLETSPVKGLRVVSSLRYDIFTYHFNNHLRATSYSGSADTVNLFKKASVKLGATYSFPGTNGVYANFSEGFVPPQVTDMYTGTAVPDLVPAVVRNYEAGGWISVLKNKLAADVSAYILRSTNEVISVRQEDGSYINRNAGKTMHKGIEAGFTAKPVKGVSFRLSGAYSRHTFVSYEEKGQRYDGREMNDAPNWMYNAELWYLPSFAQGLRLGAELRHIGKYFADPANTSVYKGYTILNLRAAYQRGNVELWVNVMNATDKYYATIVTKSAYGYSYTLGEPVNVNAGVSYNFANLFKRNK